MNAISDPHEFSINRCKFNTNRYKKQTGGSATQEIQRKIQRKAKENIFEKITIGGEQSRLNVWCFGV